MPPEPSKKTSIPPVVTTSQTFPIVSGRDNKKRKRKRHETYSSYIYKILKQVHPDAGISGRAMRIMDSFLNDLFERIAAECGRLCHYNKKATLSSREVQTAVRLLLSGEIAKYSISNGTKAVTKYNSNQSDQKK